jgi:hypothetical protein
VTSLTYLEMMEIPDFESRVEYLFLNGRVGEKTFGPRRYLNQEFYRSRIWRDFRRRIIMRDQGCDLAHPDYPIQEHDKFLIHHLNPITLDDILNNRACVLDPNNCVLVSFITHEAIHFGDMSIIKAHQPIERIPNDTIPWR